MVDELPQEIKSHKFYTTLREQSVHQDDPISEWEVIDTIDGDRSKTCICTTPILHEITIKNKINGKKLIIGSECVKRWEVQFVCKRCNSSLGNVTKRLVNKDFICPECKREEKKKNRSQIAEKNKRKKKLSGYILFWYGIYYKKRFSQIIDDEEYVNYLINYEPKNESLKAFEEYVNLCYKVIDIPIDR